MEHAFSDLPSLQLFWFYAGQADEAARCEGKMTIELVKAQLRPRLAAARQDTYLGDAAAETR